jgi:tryptophan synthase
MAAQLADTFRGCSERGRVAFVPFITAGFPTIEATPDILLAMQEAGADVVEIGMPFSDPLADGGTIQAANMVALTNGITMGKTVDAVRQARSRGLTCPVILMTYYNPVLRYGEERLAEECSKCEWSGRSQVFSGSEGWR